MEPLFSIIIPTYNRAEFLSDTLNSVLSQTFQSWECLVVDDGSKDNTAEVVSTYKDRRIKYFYKKNEERSVARNFGILRATGMYICFLDSDDLFYPHHLFCLFARIKKENFAVGMFNTGINENRGGKNIKKPVYTELDFSHPIYFIWEKFVLPSSVCIHKEILESNTFPTQFNVWEDTHLWLRLAAQYPFYPIDEVTAQWNVHEGGTVEKAFNRVKSSHVITYLKCISHLYNNHRRIIEPFLEEREIKEYQLKKLRMFLGISFNRRQYITFFLLYFYGIFSIKKMEIHRYAKSLIKGKLIQRVNNIKAAIK